MAYFLGKHLFICDVCGFEKLSDQKKKRWDNLIVCPECWEPDHPQKFVRVSPDGQPVSDPRPEPEDEFLYICYAYASQSYADIAEADCGRADINALSYQYCVELKG